MHRLTFTFLATGTFLIYLPLAHATAMMNGLNKSGFNGALLVYLLLCAISLGNAWASKRHQDRRGIAFLASCNDLTFFDKMKQER